jgi:hypothetical protein
MAFSTLRSAPEHWLLGKTVSHLSTARLPRGLDILRLINFHHCEEGKSLPESYKLACEAAIGVWARARIPTQRIDSCVRKLKKLHEEYMSLKKHRTRQREQDIQNEEKFKSELGQLFDIATKDAMIELKNDEDREFLQKQRQNVFSCSMAGSDLKTSTKENRKRQHEEKKMKAKARYEERLAKADARIASEVSSSSSDESESEDEYEPSKPVSTEVANTASSASATKTPKNIFNSPTVVGALDRVNMSDRSAVFVAGTVAQVLGHDITGTTLSRSSIRRSRIKVRREVAAAEEKELSFEGPLLLHWDGKLLPDIDGSKASVDRIAIIVTGNGQEKLLGIPKIERGTGELQARACMDAVQKWNLDSQIKGLVFDTTASNTGLHKGACIRIEQALETELIWIACRHHVMEIVLSDVFTCLFGPTVGPQTELFKRFQKQWSSINHSDIAAASDDLFQHPVLSGMRQEMLDYLPNALETQQPRDDYQELLHLSLLFLGGCCPNKAIRAPGPTHHARWMGRGIYALKLFLFRAQFQMTARQLSNITDLALFVSLVYVRQWNEAPMGIRAPYNDVELLSTLNTYPNQIVAKKALEAISRHLWFLSEHLVALAFFDDRITPETKQQMVRNLKRPPLPHTPRRLVGTDAMQPVMFENLVTQRTQSFFDLLIEEGSTKANTFLNKHPTEWTDDTVFKELWNRASKLTVVNDAAERGISLIEKYNDTLTKDEEQKQFVLRLVASHRKKFPSASKGALMS